jgi:DNA-binding transcriptional LysR family regulator
MLLFVRTVDHGGFSAAARSLELTPSAVSKQVRRLEDRLGVRLLNRSTRRVTFTAEGRAFYERAARIATDISELEEFATAMGEQVRGTLRVTATVAFAKARLLPLFPEFLRAHPDLDLELEVTDRSVDLIEEKVDVAIRFTEQISDTSLIARKIASNRRVICASPAYLDTKGVPEQPEDLLRYNCLRLSTVSSWNDWEFQSATGKKTLQVKGDFQANSADAIYHAVLAGLGIARLSTYLVGEDLRAGRLVNILPEHRHETSDILAVYPDRRNLSPKVRAFIDFLVDHFGPVPPWEQNLRN